MFLFIIFHMSCHTWVDLLDQDGRLGGQSEAMRVEVRVPLDLNIEAERVVPLIGAGLLIYRNSVSGGGRNEKKENSFCSCALTVCVWQP